MRQNQGRAVFTLLVAATIGDLPNLIDALAWRRLGVGRRAPSARGQRGIRPDLIGLRRRPYVREPAGPFTRRSWRQGDRMLDLPMRQGPTQGPSNATNFADVGSKRATASRDRPRVGGLTGRILIVTVSAVIVSIAVAFSTRIEAARWPARSPRVVTSGVATFSGLNLNKVGSGYTLLVISGTLTSATSSCDRCHARSRHATGDFDPTAVNCHGRRPASA